MRGPISRWLKGSVASQAHPYAVALAEQLGSDCDVVLLGSVATGKYIDVLLPILGDRLLFPQEFLGHGDMARGAMLLKRAAAGVELTYTPVSDPRRG